MLSWTKTIEPGTTQVELKQMSENAKWAEALKQAQASVEALKKNKDGYIGKFVSTEQIIIEARGALSRAGLTVCRSKQRYASDGSYQASNKGGEYEQKTWKVTCTFLVTHESGEFVEMETEMAVIPEKGKPLDKAVASASTFALGYFLRDLLLIPRVGEGEEVNLRDDADFDPTKGSFSDMLAEYAKLRTMLGEAVADGLVSTPKTREDAEIAIDVLRTAGRRRSVSQTATMFLGKLGAKLTEKQDELLKEMGLPGKAEWPSLTFDELVQVSETLSKKWGGK